MKPDNIILEGITGSQAYGLAHDDSDTDIKGIFVAPTSKILSLYNVRDSYDHKDPDYIYYEVGRFIELALKNNPSILEVLYLDGYLESSKWGKMLVDIRKSFLYTKGVRKAYSGYCLGQARKLNATNGKYGNGRTNRYEKHTRHLFRLLQQGRELLETGDLTVQVANRDEIFAFGKLPIQDVVDYFTEQFYEFDKIVSVLPEEPDKEAINTILIRIRKAYW